MFSLETDRVYSYNPRSCTEQQQMAICPQKSNSSISTALTQLWFSGTIQVNSYKILIIYNNTKCRKTATRENVYLVKR